MKIKDFITQCKEIADLTTLNSDFNLLHDKFKKKYPSINVQYIIKLNKKNKYQIVRIVDMKELDALQLR